MKQNTINFMLPLTRLLKWIAFVLLPIVGMFICSCSENRDEDEPETPSSAVKFNLTLVLPDKDMTIYSPSAYDTTITGKFSSYFYNDASFRVLVRQNGAMINLDKSKIEILNDDGNEGKIEVDGSGQIDANKPYDIYVLGGSWRYDEDDVYYRTTMLRNKGFNSWLKCSNRDINTKKQMTCCGTIEYLYIINKSGSPIKFKHKGFDAEEKWYYSYAEVAIGSGKVTESEYGDVEGDVQEIPVYPTKKGRSCLSFYVPNGKKIQNAQLIAEINGKEVRSENRISSDIVPQLNHVYAMFAVWDGEKLTLGDDGSGIIDSVIELPADGNITLNDISVMCDGQNVEISEDGSFETDASSIIAYNGNNIVYLSCAGKEKKHKLNASETAVSLLLPSIPLILSDLDDNQLYVLKAMIGHLPETKTLADAINQSVKTKGFLDTKVIEPQFKAAAKELKRRCGLDGNYTRSYYRRVSTRTEAGAPSYPYFRNTTSKESKADGFTVTMTSSSLEEKDGKKFWRCKFDLLNADRFCYTSFTTGYKTEKGFFERSDKSFTATFKNLIKPMNVSAFMDYGTLSDLATKPEEFLTSLSEPDFDRVWNLWWGSLKNFGHYIKGQPLETLTFDKIQKKDIEFCFYTSNEHLLIAGPGTDDNLLFFNAVRIGFQPVLKMIIGEVKKTDGYAKSDMWDKIFVEFVKWIAEFDSDFGTRLVSTFTDSSLSWGEKIEIFGEVFDRFDKFFQEMGLNLVSEAIYKNCMKSLAKGYKDPQIKAIFAVYKTVLMSGDILLLLLDNSYKGVAFELEQGLDEYNSNLDIIPGHDL